MSDLRCPLTDCSIHILVRSIVLAGVCRCCSQDAIGFQTTVEARIAQEDFTATGLMVIERNWLNVYKYTSWGGSEVPPMEPGSTFVPSELSLRQGQTEPPPKLTERDLLALMDRFGIGTDATVSDHIAKQQVLSQFLLSRSA